MEDSMKPASPGGASSYIHGTSAPEQRRLSILNDLMNEASLRELSLRSGEHILDVGSGLGQFTRRMAREAGAARPALGIERDGRQLALAQSLAQEAGETGLVEFRQGDAQRPPLAPSEWGTFDLAHARFVLEHVPDPLAVVRSMVQAVKPGGRIVLEDDDHDVLRLWPEPPGFRSLWEAYIRTYDRLGNDPFIGRRLVELLVQAGAQPIRNTWIFFGSCAHHPAFLPLAENLIHILEGARQTIQSQHPLDPAYVTVTLTALEEWSRRSDAALWYSICWAEGMKPTHR